MLNELLMLQIKKELEDIVGIEWVQDCAADNLPASIDTWWVPRMMLMKRREVPVSKVIVFPKTAEEIGEILRIARFYGMPVIPRGGGAGDTGGIVPVKESIMLDLKRMNSIVEIDEISHIVTCETGMYYADLEQQLNARGYTTNHLPASMFCSTIGGFIATRGSGVLSSKYGKLEDLVVTMKVVLPNGRIMKTAPVPKHSTGPQFSFLFMGSEGTLGIVYEVSLKIFQLPETRRFLVFTFSSLHNALEAGRQVMIKGIKPSVVRVYDEGDTRRMVAPVLGMDELPKSLLIMSFDGFERIVKAEMEVAREVCLHQGGTLIDEQIGIDWWMHRYDFYYPPFTLESTPFMYAVCDTVAVYSKLERIYVEMKKQLEEKFKDYELEYIAHFSHWYEWGTIIYPNFIVRNVPNDPYEAYKLYDDIWKTAIEIMIKFGGCLNEHHGVGLKLGKYMPTYWQDEYNLLKVIKKALDPDNILNPGKMGLEAKV